MPNVDMNLIREAIQRRSQGQTVPQTDQMTTPQGNLPTGGVNTPAMQTPNVQTGVNLPTGTPQGLPQRQIAMKAGQVDQSPQFDAETKELGKALVKKLLEIM